MWLPSVLIILTCFYSYSEDVCKRGFTVIIDMRGSKWDLIKPLLKTLQEAFPAEIHVALIIKPDNFWQKQKTNFGSSKFIFEVRTTWGMCGKALLLIKNVLQGKDFSSPVLEGKNGIRGLHPKGTCPGTRLPSEHTCGVGCLFHFGDAHMHGSHWWGFFYEFYFWWCCIQPFLCLFWEKQTINKQTNKKPPNKQALNESKY